MTHNGRTPEAARAAGRSMMIPGAWEPRRPLTYIPASDAGSLSTISPYSTVTAAPVAAGLQAVPPQTKAMPIALFVMIMMIMTWVMLWIAA